MNKFLFLYTLFLTILVTLYLLDIKYIHGITWIFCFISINSCSIIFLGNKNEIWSKMDEWRIIYGNN